MSVESGAGNTTSGDRADRQKVTPMLLSKSLRAATLAVAGVFLATALPAAAAPVLPSAKPAGIESAKALELAATAKKKKPVKKKVAKKKTAAKKRVA
ncbi:hypothetical protein STAQ_46880 [Allostella sp. ATCC 35155]|nr:hypothetical protein STAQ_46880 [Stella sp. ATCC 35155]